MFDVMQYEQIVKNVARKVAADFPGHIEVEDMEMELYCFLLERSKYFDKEVASAIVYKALTEQAKKVGWEQRKQHLVLTPQYTYRPSDVRRILETMFNYTTWPDARVPDDAKSIKGNDALEMSSDVAWAFSKMTHEPYKQAIAKRYRDGIQPENGSADSKRLSRAIQTLTEILNYYMKSAHEDGPGARKAITNARAAYNISAPYGQEGTSPGGFDRR